MVARGRTHWIAAALILGTTVPALAAVATSNVLVIYSNGRLLPGNIEGDRGLNQALTAPPGHEIALYSEFLDAPRFAGEVYDRVVTEYLRAKYAATPLDVIVAVRHEAHDFLLRHREALFPGVPVVHAAVDRRLLSSRPSLPADVIGVPVDFRFTQTIELALRLHPDARRLVIVTGAAEPDRSMEAQLEQELSAFAGRVEVEQLSGLPTPVLLRRLAALGSSDVVLTTGFFRDGDGREFAPAVSVTAIAAASAAPVYGPFTTFIGTGIVGGSMPSFEEMGRQAGLIASELLAGADPGSLRLPEVIRQTVNVDWRQLRHWGIDQSAIPEGAIVHFRPPTLLEAHRSEVIAAAVVVVLQTGLIGGLLAERRRRRSAEMERETHRRQLAHASRLATAGELTASIAHEINQPLGAILSNADAADLVLDAGGDSREELRAILADIRRDDLRASEVIRRLRALLAKHKLERRPFDLVEAAREAESMLRPEAHRRRVALDLRSEPGPQMILGDRTQMQQVLINLALNAMDAVSAQPEGKRAVEVSVGRSAAGPIAVAVRDSGPGISPEHLPQLFDPFFTTKRSGMGLGLSIARTLVEAHGGHIWAENLPEHGAVFHLELPEAGSADIESAEWT